MYYLLGTEIILDISRGTDNPASRWIARIDQSISARDIKVSTMSWAAIEIEFQSTEKRQSGRLTSKQEILRERIKRVFEKYRQLGSILPFTDKANQIWVRHLQTEIQYSDPDGHMRPVGFEEKMILATAIAGSGDVAITLVARKEAAHNHFAILGLRIENPYVERTTP